MFILRPQNLILPDGSSVSNKDELLDNWVFCLECETPLMNKKLSCPECKTLRSLETFPNLLSNPSQVTQIELDLLKKRRKIEKQQILELEERAADSVNEEDQWYLISSDWLLRWKFFVSNHVSSKYKNRD